MSPVFQSRNVTFWKGGGISTFGEGGREALAPGMIGTRNGWGSLFLERLVKVFGRHNLGLSGLLVEDGEGQRFAIIQDGDVLVGVETDDDLGVA